MATVQQTMVNGIGWFGPAPPNKWNSMVWGSDLWGEGDNSMLVHPIRIRTMTCSTVSFENDPTDMYKRTSNNYYYVFRLPTLNADDRANTEWSES